MLFIGYKGENDLYNFGIYCNLNFYKEKFNFHFLTTEFKKGWENNICKKLLELDKYVKLQSERSRK